MDSNFNVVWDLHNSFWLQIGKYCSLIAWMVGVWEKLSSKEVRRSGLRKVSFSGGILIDELSGQNLRKATKKIYGLSKFLYDFRN